MQKMHAVQHLHYKALFTTTFQGRRLEVLILRICISNSSPSSPPSTCSAPCPWDQEAGTLADWIRPRVLELVYTSHSLEPFARNLGYTGPPFAWDPERRFQLRCELDAAFFHLYGIERDDADYILDTFPIVKKKDEATFGEYRTKRVILETYDEYSEAMRRFQHGIAG